MLQHGHPINCNASHTNLNEVLSFVVCLNHKRCRFATQSVQVKKRTYIVAMDIIECVAFDDIHAGKTH